MIRSTALAGNRCGSGAVLKHSARLRAMARGQTLRAASTISTPALVNLERRWPEMSTDEQAELLGKLIERQKDPWTELSHEEKKAGMCCALCLFGNIEACFSLLYSVWESWA